MSLPILKDDNQPFQLMQTKWKSQLDPVIAVPLLSGHVLRSVQLVEGLNTINHKLGAVLQGWFLVRKRQWITSGTPTVYDVTDTQGVNPMPSLTLQLYSTEGTTDNPVIVDLWVY